MRVPYERRVADLYYRDDNYGKHDLACSAHLHYHIEFFLLLDGHTRATVDTACYDVLPGDLLMVFPNQIHRYEEVARERYVLFIVNPDLAPDLSAAISSENPQDPVIRSADKNPRIMSLIDILGNTQSFATAYRETLLRGYFMSFFAEILGMLPLRHARPDENQSMRAVVQYCSKNFTKDLSLSALEEEIHLSKYYISHLFGDKLGIRFNDYVNSLRISEACRLLRMTKMNITEISCASGFGTLRTFNRAFTKQMNTSPSEYRKHNRGEILDVSIPVGDNDHSKTDTE
jgi:AraC-like DNA-binding protein